MIARIDEAIGLLYSEWLSTSEASSEIGRYAAEAMVAVLAEPQQIRCGTVPLIHRERGRATAAVWRVASPGTQGAKALLSITNEALEDAAGMLHFLFRPSCLVSYQMPLKWFVIPQEIESLVRGHTNGSH